MSTGEGQDPRGGPPPRDRDERNDRSRRGDSIGIGGGDDSVSRIQLAARWAEAYGREGDSLTSALKRFRTAYEYLDAVIHGVDPPELEAEVAEAPPPAYAPPAPQWTSPSATPPPESASPSPWSRPTEPGATQPPAPPSEPRPWG